MIVNLSLGRPLQTQPVFINELLQSRVGPNTSVGPGSGLADVDKKEFHIRVTGRQQDDANRSFVVVVHGGRVGKALDNTVFPVHSANG
jgi:hypothetical protein